jgi:hypothetical protein
LEHLISSCFTMPPDHSALLGQQLRASLRYWQVKFSSYTLWRIIAR